MAPPVRTDRRRGATLLHCPFHAAMSIPETGSEVSGRVEARGIFTVWVRTSGIEWKACPMKRAEERVMEKRRRLGAWVFAAATFCGSSAWVAPAAADFDLNAKYTAVITDVQEYYGALGTIARGDEFSGVIQYSSPAFAPDYEDGSFADYQFPAIPGVDVLLTADLGALHLEVKQYLTLSISNDAVDSIYGYDFQFGDDSTSLKTPGGYTIGPLGAEVGLYLTGPSLLDFPNPPSTLPPIGAYDPFSTGGYILAQVRDAGGNLVETASFQFRLTSVQSVPEPSSILLAATGFPLIVAWSRRRKLGRRN